MCGIAGMRSDKIDVAQKTLHMMNNLHHRGPDDFGQYTHSNFSLGHKRLSIIDLKGGKQPITNEDESIVLVFNGEIYNYKELKKHLELKGHQFKTHSDSEVIIHLYEEYHLQSLEKLNGMFAFAIYDKKNQTLCLARDRMGIKPLFYYHKNDIFAFSSEIQALKTIKEIKQTLTLNAQALWHYFSLLFIPSPYTIYNEITALQPANYLLIGPDEYTENYYWKPPKNVFFNHNIDECADSLQYLIDQSVRLQMQSDVPYGAFLSGGIDSSLVVSSMAKQSHDPIKTFSVKVCDEELDDSKYAEIIAKKYQTHHFRLSIDQIDSNLLINLIHRFGQPFADSSILPTFLVSKMIRSHVTVALGGDGADELFAGYNKYKQIVTKMDSSIIGNSFFRVPENLKKSVFTKDFIGQHLENTLSAITDLCYYKPTDAFDHLRQLDSRIFLEGDILTKVDIMSMAHSLEARVPLLDNNIIDYAWNIPPRFLFKHETGKVVLKHLLHRSMPESFVYRPKIGFMLPVNRWLKSILNQLFDEALQSSIIQHSGFFNIKILNHMGDKVKKGNQEIQYSHLLFAFIVFYLWLREQ